MKKNNTEKLESELKLAGASADEAKLLSNYALSFEILKGTEPRLSSKHTQPKRLFQVPHRSLRVLIASFTTVGVLALGLIIASIAQTTIPGNLLYSVKHLTENVAIIIQPNYRGELMMRRAQEVKQLVVLQKSPTLINTTLQSYKTDVAEYKGGNYADLEYCENTLHQAENMSNGTVRLAIAETIASVQNDSE